MRGRSGRRRPRSTCPLRTSGAPGSGLPATDLEALGRIDGGQTRTSGIVYPAVGDLDEVTVQVDEGLGSAPFRLNDIPVR